MSDSDEKMFEYDFSQLATYENGRTPVLLTEEQYRRDRACVNACKGFSTEQLEEWAVSGGMSHLFGIVICMNQAAAMVRAEKQRDDLLADVERCYKMLLSEQDTRGALFKAENILREAIAQVKGN